jgi:hypothetical protein
LYVLGGLWSVVFQLGHEKEERRKQMCREKQKPKIQE